MMGGMLTRRREISDLARSLLRSIWVERGEIWGFQSIDVNWFLQSALEPIVTRKMKMRIERPPLIAATSGTQAAGVLDRNRGVVSVVSSIPLDWARFTLAHEIGHYFLHPDILIHRDMFLGGWCLDGVKRPAKEIEADLFAAELLMPKKAVEQVFYELWGGALTGVTDALAQVLSDAHRTKLSKSMLNAQPLKQRAKYVAGASSAFRTPACQPLSLRFGVSQTAMAIRLVELALIR
jgi:Zn-dependent peptidase ImmA (M78 family)